MYCILYYYFSLQCLFFVLKLYYSLLILHVAFTFINDFRIFYYALEVTYVFIEHTFSSTFSVPKIRELRTIQRTLPS